jgi:hypothetical protein
VTRPDEVHPVVPVVTLMCTACELVFEPELATFGTGTTGCPECGGWTWIAHLRTTECPRVTGPEHPAPPVFDDIRPELAGRGLEGSPPGRVSPTTPPTS